MERAFAEHVTYCYAIVGQRRDGRGRGTNLFQQGKAVENVIDDRACRTKLAVQPVGDLEKLCAEWDQWGWHRVTCFGDLKEPIAALADALGWQVLHEA